MKTDLISEDRKVYNRGFLKQAVKLAETGQCSSVLFFRDTFADPNTSFDIKTSLKLITVTQHASESSRDGLRYTLSVRLFSEGRLTQLRSALLLGLIHGYIKADEKICCIGGLPTSDRLDTVILLEVQREIQPIFAENNDLLPSEVRPEVFERVLSLATELATEGREGHAVGCLFVLGNVDRLSPYVHPLILNPFFGYAAGDRNILTTAVDETVKEYALLDGAFIINGDGVIESAGSLIQTDEYVHLPSGLGTRHAAAVAISKAVDCIAVTVSSSTRQVCLFRKGVMLPLFTKGFGYGNAT